MNFESPKNLAGPELLERLERETTAALKRIYQLDQPTPMSSVTLEGGCKLSLKREDTSRVHSYKWRGATNKISHLVEQGFNGALVAASAGNHAQGVAVAAKQLKLKATIFMPVSTPVVKQRAVKNFGGDQVDIVLHGDVFDEAAVAAQNFAGKHGGEIIAPYDDLYVIAGQSTIGVEIVNTLKEAPTHIFLAIGGGGMVAGVSSVLKKAFPDAVLIGVEETGQASMQASISKGQRVTLDTIDRFCDGTAVACPGQLNFELCRQLLDECLTVHNDQVCQAIQFLWQELRIIVEPSAAIGVAAARNYGLTANDRALTVISGSNVDFMTFPQIAKRGQVEIPEERYFCFEIGEQPGALIGILDHFFGNMNIIDFQYGKVAQDRAYPVIGIEVPRSARAELEGFLQDPSIPPYKEVTGTASAEFRVIPFSVDLLNRPLFAVITFPNRPGALRDFMRGAGDLANVCYMNYTDSGQAVGQALMGFEFQDTEASDTFLKWLEDSDIKFETIPMATIRHLGQTQKGEANEIGSYSADFIRRGQ